MPTTSSSALRSILSSIIFSVTTFMRHSSPFRYPFTPRPTMATAHTATTMMESTSFFSTNHRPAPSPPMHSDSAYSRLRHLTASTRRPSSFALRRRCETRLGKIISQQPDEVSHAHRKMHLDR